MAHSGFLSAAAKRTEQKISRRFSWTGSGSTSVTRLALSAPIDERPGSKRDDERLKLLKLFVREL
jgi:hypothetical protein